MYATQRISTDTAIPVLADQRVRRVPHRLTDRTGPATVDEHVEASATDEFSPTDAAGIPGPLALPHHHVHRRTLRDAGIVEYDPRGEPIRYHPNGRVEGVTPACTSR